MRIFRSIRRLGILLLLCVSCAAVMTVLAFHSRDEGVGGNKGEETIVGRMIERIADGEVDLSDENSIRRAISEGEAEFGISLTEENRDRVVGFLQKLDTAQAGAEDFMEQAQQMYRKYSTEFVEEANDTINGAVENALQSAVRNFFQTLVQSIRE